MRCRGKRVPELPTGTVTFLFTDIRGSTRLWEQYAESMEAALVRHDAPFTAAGNPMICHHRFDRFVQEVPLPKRKQSLSPHQA
jgi:hypothetical protein